MQDNEPSQLAAFYKIGSCIYPRGEEATVSFRDVAYHFGTYRSVIHEHPSGGITRDSVREVEDRLARLGKINL